MNSTALWKERFRHFLKEVRTYSKYVFNDHLKFIFVFIIGAGAYYYQQWLQTLTPSFPTAIVMAVLLGLVLTAGSIQTLLKEADLVYLLPVEEKLKPYFTKAFLFTFMIQLYIIAMVAAALAPLYFQQMKQTGANLHMDCNRVCHCKSVEFIRSVGKIIFNRSKCSKSRLVYSLYFKRLICVRPCRTYFSHFYRCDCLFNGAIPCCYASKGEGKAAKLGVFNF